MGSCSAVSTIVQNWREHPPYYSLKIQNFSQFENSTASSDHKYQSRLFSSGGSNWRLIVYPKGNVKDNGSGFISMYVEIDSSSLIESTPPTEVFAELRFYVYNKKENKYFIKDVEVKRFNALKMVRGLLQVLPYDTFINPENGYIFEGGECEFGVDVIVVPPGLTNWEILSFDEKLPYPKFSWAVKNFSELTKEFYTSNIFSMGGRKWVLRLYPKGDCKANGKYLSVYLLLADSETLKPDEKIFTQGNGRVLDPLGSNHLTYKLNCWHKESNDGWGWSRFVSLTELRKTYLDKKDTLNVEFEFNVVSSIKYSPII